MKNKLLNAMKSLPMTIEDKQEFVNTIINNSKGGGEAILYYYKFNGKEYVNYLKDTYDDDSFNDQIEVTCLFLNYYSKMVLIHLRKEGMDYYLDYAHRTTSTEHFCTTVAGFIIENPTIFEYPYCFNGDFNRIAEFLTTDPSFGDEGLKPLFDDMKKYLTPVTKEEFYSNLDKQPIIV